MPPSVNEPEPAPDPEVRAERAHLAAARAALHQMRETVLDTETPEVFGDWVSTQALRQARDVRAEALRDFADIPLFFGRLDYPAGAVFERAPEQESPAPAAGTDRVYIGRRHVHDLTGTPMVIDWRAPISMAFYRATPGAPMGARMRRRYGFGAGGGAVLTAYEDEPLDELLDGHPQGAAAHAEPAPESDLLAAEIERPRSGPMRDIVATIQPEQDELVRAPLDVSLCVQGAPGTGKTAVGLHRIAYLLYAERARLSRSGVIIIGPNSSFLSYIRNVLPALGEVDVRQATIEELLDTVPARRVEEPHVAWIKGDARMAEVIRRDLWSLPRDPEEPLVVQRGSRRWRVYTDELAEILAELRGREISFGAGRDLLGHRLAHTVLTRIEASGEACDDRTHNQVKGNSAVRAMVNRLWPKADPVRLVLGLLTTPERLARAADGILSAEEQEAVLLPGRPRGPKSARWSAADLPLIDEAAHLIERISVIGHLVVDEAQDLSPMQCRAIGRRGGSGSLTVLGDLAQGTAPWATSDWPTLLHHLGRPEAEVSVLERGFRVPAQIIDYAARLLPSIAPHLGRPTAVRRVPGALRIAEAPAAKLGDALVAACRAELAGAGSVGVIAADAAVPGLRRRLAEAELPVELITESPDAMETSRLVLVPAGLAKGLEFDSVIVVEPSEIAAAESRGLHRLYVVLTRAVSALHVLHSLPLPGVLAEPG